MTRYAEELYDLIERVGHPEEFVCLTHGSPIIAGICDDCEWELAERQYERRTDV